MICVVSFRHELRPIAGVRFRSTLPQPPAVRWTGFLVRSAPEDVAELVEWGVEVHRAIEDVPIHVIGNFDTAAHALISAAMALGVRFTVLDPATAWTGRVVAPGVIECRGYVALPGYHRTHDAESGFPVARISAALRSRARRGVAARPRWDEDGSPACGEVDVVAGLSKSGRSGSRGLCLVPETLGELLRARSKATSGQAR